MVVARNDVGSGISSQLFYIENATSRNFGSGCELHTAIDMGRGLLHIVIEDSAKQMLVCYKWCLIMLQLTLGLCRKDC